MEPLAIRITNRSCAFTHHASMQDDFFTTEVEHTAKLDMDANDIIDVVPHHS